MKYSAEALRSHIDKSLSLSIDPRHSHDYSRMSWQDPLARMEALRKEKGNFFRKFGYEWACEAAAYNSPMEAYFQWRVLNTLSDIRSDHPHLDRRGSIIVRLIPTSCARSCVRRVDDFGVIVLTTGYLSAFKDFIRLWFLGRARGNSKAQGWSTDYRKAGEEYLAGLKTQESAMIVSALAFLGTLINLQQDEVPIMHHDSIFDETVLKRDQFLLEFELLSLAVDGFILFHETSHLLNRDDIGANRTTYTEIEADIGSVSLGIIDEARKGGVGTVHLGAPIFFSLELLRLLFEEIRELRAGTHDPSKGRYVGIDELMLRSIVYINHLEAFLPSYVVQLYVDWKSSFMFVFDTVRFALLKETGTVPSSLYDFAISGGKKGDGNP